MLVFFVKSTHALPYLNNGRRSQSLWNRIRSAIINVPIKDVGDKRIETAPWPTHISQDGTLQFATDALVAKEHAGAIANPVKADMLVWATGFKPSYAINLGLDNATVRGIHAPGDGVRMGFIGFVRPSLGEFMNTQCP